MIVGILQFELLIHDAQSLKDKRRVVRSLKDRLHREHMVAVAEVGRLEVLNSALLGLACVGSEGRAVGEVLDRIAAKLGSLHEAELGFIRRAIIDEPDENRSAVLSEDDEAAISTELLRHARDFKEPA